MSAALELDPTSETPLRKIELAEAEADLLLEVCLLHRRRLPIYLRSTREILERIDAVIEKLSRSQDL